MATRSLRARLQSVRRRLLMLGSATALVWGLAAAVPLFILFVWVMNSPREPMVRIRRILDALLRPVMGRWCLLKLALLSVLAGLGEELFFRGFLQAGLARFIGLIPALAVASCVFGVCHLVTRAYGLMAAVVGIYLGLLWIWTNNLLVPITAHALHDFVALVYFLRLLPTRRTSRHD